MKNTKRRVALLITLCLVIASLVTVLIVSAVGADDSDVVTVAYANGTVETYMEGETIVPIEVPKDFAKCDENGDAYVFTVSEGADWSFTIDGKALSDMTVTADMLGKTVQVDIAGTLGTEKLWYTIHESIVDETVPEDLRGDFWIYGYDEESLITYLSLNNVGEGGLDEPRYRYLRQRDNVFHIKLYTDIYPTKFDPRWGSAGKTWEIYNKDGTKKDLYQDRTWRGTYDSNGNPTGVSGTSASVYIDLNGHTIEIGSSESFHFGSMACTPYSMRLWIYSTTPGAVFSGTKSEAVFYSDDDTTVTVGELDEETVQYGKNLSVYGKMVTHINYGGGVYLYGGRYYQAGANPEFINISYRLYAVQNCEFYLADQSQAVLYFDQTRASGGRWYRESSANNSKNLKFENCVFYVNQYGTKLVREVASRNEDTKVEKDPVEQDNKYPLRFENCEFYGIPVEQTSCYLTMSYLGETAYSVGTADNYGTESEPMYISYLKNPTKTKELVDDLGLPFTVEACCALRSASAVACVQYGDEVTYWEPGVTPFVQDNVVRAESYVETDGVYLGLPAVLVAGQTYAAKGVAYNERIPFAFVYTMANGTEGYGLVGADAIETGRSFASKFGSLSEGSITLLSNITLTKNVDFGTKGKVYLDLNGYSMTVAENASINGAVHRVGDGMTLTVYSSRAGSVYENLSNYPIFSLAHGGKGGNIVLGDYTPKGGDLYPGTNVTYVSKGSFFLGYPTAKNVTAIPEFKATNTIFIYTGSQAAFRFANAATLNYAKVVLAPEAKGASPIAIATVDNAVAYVSCGSVSFYAAEGTNATAYACLNAAGEAVSSAVEEQTVNLGNCSFHGVLANKGLTVENVTLTYSGYAGFSSMESLALFYGVDVPAGQMPVRGSAQFYIDGKLVYLPIWLYAKPADTATVTFDSGTAGIGSFEETWMIGSMACQENFVVDGIFVYTYGRRQVATSNNRLTAACVSLVPGAMRVNLSFTAEMKLNLWIPMDSPITSVTAESKTYSINSTLSYKDNYYIVQIPVTPSVLAGSIKINVVTDARAETVSLNFVSYVESLLQSATVSAEEKALLYAIMQYGEKISGVEPSLASPQGYVNRAVIMDEPATFGEDISAVTVEYNKGLILRVSGTSGAVVRLETADGFVEEARIIDGAASFAGMPLWALAGEITLSCGDEVYTYTLGIYKASVPAIQRTVVDVLYTVAYYADKWNAAVKGE